MIDGLPDLLTDTLTDLLMDKLSDRLTNRQFGLNKLQTNPEDKKNFNEPKIGRRGKKTNVLPTDQWTNQHTDKVTYRVACKPLKIENNV